MWSDNDIDNAFRRLDPAEPEPTPFPLDGWLKLESQLDQAVIDRAVRRRLWQFFAAEVAVVALVGLGWSLWPTGMAASVGTKDSTAAASTQSWGQAATTGRKRLAQAASASAPQRGSSQPSAPNTVSGMLQLNSAPTGAAPMPTAAATAPATAYAAMPVRAPHKRQRQLPLADALAAQAGMLSPGHSYPTDNRQPVAGHEGVDLATPNRRPGSGPVEAQAASAAVAASGSANAQPTAVAEGYSIVVPAARTTDASRIDGPTAAPAQAAGEVAVADATSQRANAPSTNATGIATLPGIANAASLAPAEPLAAALVRPDFAALPTTLSPTAATAPPLPAPVGLPRLYVGLVAAPDVSTVKFADVQAPRLNAGLTLEYRLGTRWRVATGLQRAHKAYYARRTDYDWTNYPRAQARDFDWVEGQCTVLDVPLNLRYDAVVHARGRWFGTAGLSSFFMQRENYSYDYLESGTYKNWELPGLVNANRHFFSVLNLSAGYEYDLGPHWRLQAEPYAKVPLAGVGAGKVKLLSGGVYVGLKYGF